MILLDTHVVLWLAFEPSRISKLAQRKIQESHAGGKGLAISCITLLELAILERRGRFYYDAPIDSFLTDIEARFHVLAITALSCAKVLQLPANYPRDPADRIIGATALVEGMPLITADKGIRQSKAVPVIW